MQTSPARVVVVAPGYGSYEPEQRALSALGRVEELDWAPDRRALLSGLVEADIVLVRDTPLDEEAIAAMSRARGIIRYGVGTDTIDLAAASLRRIMVANIPDYGAATDVSEHALGLLLAVTRGISARDRNVRGGTWDFRQVPMRRIAGGVLGLVGYGRIARALHQRILALGVARVLANDPLIPAEQVAACGAEPVSLRELVAQADFISLHAPGSPSGVPLLDREVLSHVRHGAILINTARGTLVEETALADALRTGLLAGAGLDVFRYEPFDTLSPLFGAPNLTITDHVAWYSEESLRSLQQQAGEQARDMLLGRAPANWVNRW
jgi:D-3-phosphoglycerate dehydrogenase / 2-oxoglutarate reductase